MIRVLQVLDNITAGGIQSFVMNVYRNIDKTQIQFDFLIHHAYEKSFHSEIESLGGRVFELPSRSQGLIKNKKALDDFFSKHAKEFGAIHFHESSLSYLEPLKYARKYDVPVRIMHSHNTRVPNSIIHSLLHRMNKKVIGKYANRYLACGEMAAKWMYGESSVEKDVIVVYNGIDLSKYEYSIEKRSQIRHDLGISNKFVIGHAGRFEPVKNHKFLLEIMKAICEIRTDVVLLLAGNGRTFEDMKQYAAELKIDNNVIFLGVRNDLDYLYQGMDVMVLPSLYEGFPVTAIEAEASGLPCIMADTITKEALLKENVVYLSLEDPISLWVDEILKKKERLTDNAVLYKKGLSIESTVEYLTKIYLQTDR